MDPHSPPFPGKTQASKPRAVRKPVHVSKINVKEPQISRQKRVFGTVRNPNIPAKTMSDQPIKTSISDKKTVAKSSKSTNFASNPPAKPSISDKKTEPKSSKSTNFASNPPAKPSISDKKTEPKSSKSTNIASNPPPETSKKSSCFGKQTEKNPSISQAQNISEPATPIASGSCNKPRIISTPYYSAENCSKCRFDKLETASYWIGQIKLAESVCKHFVSASFFRLACESKAEPIRNIRKELKRYLVRHEHLRKETEWMEVSLAYGLLKDENSNIEERHYLAVVEAGAGINISNDLEQDQKKLKEPDEAERN